MAKDALLITINLDILPPRTIADIANSLLHEIGKLHGNHDDNEITIKARAMHRAILSYLADVHGESWLEEIDS